MKKITKAIVPAAGLGTRFLPITKAVPKEMIPIIDKPTLQYIVEEAVKAGIKELGIIVSAEKPTINSFFTKDKELERKLSDQHKKKELKLVREISNLIDVHFIYQYEPKGLGHAVLCAKEFVGDDDFAIMLGDDLMVNNGKPVLEQLIDAYNQTNKSILGVQKVKDEDVSKYGIINPVSTDTRLMKVNSIVEKPNLELAPSNYAVLGRYILTNEIFSLLENQEPGKGWEIQLTDSIARLISQDEVYAYEFEGKRYDVGDKLGFIKATIDFALSRDEFRDEVQAYIDEKSRK